LRRRTNVGDLLLKIVAADGIVEKRMEVKGRAR
jgi:hypothetical protein